MVRLFSTDAPSPQKLLLVPLIIIDHLWNGLCSSFVEWSCPERHKGRKIGRMKERSSILRKLANQRQSSLLATLAVAYSVCSVQSIAHRYTTQTARHIFYLPNENCKSCLSSRCIRPEPESSKAPTRLVHSGRNPTPWLATFWKSDDSVACLLAPLHQNGWFERKPDAAVPVTRSCPCV